MATAAEYSWLSSCENNAVVKGSGNRLSKAMIGWYQIENVNTLDRHSKVSVITHLKKLFLLLVVLFLMIPGYSIAEETMCRDLKPVNNLDELLYQFYSNLDSDCLFTMPLSELEAAWGIKILSEERIQQGQTLGIYPELRRSTDFAGKPYLSEADAYYVEAFRRDNRTATFSIYMTDEYGRMHATLFPEGNYPRLLPEPVKRRAIRISYNEPPLPFNEPLRRPQNPGIYTAEHFYFWLNVNRTHMIYMSTSLTSAVGLIKIFDKVPSDFLREVTE